MLTVAIPAATVACGDGEMVYWLGSLSKHGGENRVLGEGKKRLEIDLREG
jgi:hypothetical protein